MNIADQLLPLLLSAPRSRSTAVVNPCGDTLLSYADLLAGARLTADALRGLGVGGDDCVPVLMGRSVQQWVNVLGVLMAGAAYVPVDPMYPAEWVASVLVDSRPKVILVDEGLRRLLPWEGEVIGLGGGSVAVVNPSGGGGGGGVEVGADPLAYVIYTSGSTGKPKGVAMGHGPLLNLLQWQQRQVPVESGERTLQYTSSSFDVSFQEVFSTWFGGGTVVLVSEETRRDPVRLLRHIELQGVNRVFMPFVALQQLAQAGVRQGIFPRTLKDVVTAGEQLVITDGIRDFARQIAGLRLHNHYGPAETHVVTALTLERSVEGWPVTPSIGREIDGVRLHLLDADRRPVADGLEGEIYLGGDCLARGYLHNEGLTAERFIELPGHGRVYRSGDLGMRLGDGNIQFLGRADHQVKIRGIRVELGEVETVLRRHAVVKDCVATAVLRDGEKRLVAYVVGEEGQELDARVLRRHMREQLPEHMVPSLFARLDRVPLTGSGKADRKALPDPALSSLEGMGERVKPGTEMEAKIARVWGEVLGVAEVGVEDSFFDLGGTSLSIVTLQQRLVELVGKEFEVALLFQHSTVRLQARHLGGDGGGEDRMKVLQDRGARQRAAAERAAVARRAVSGKG